MIRQIAPQFFTTDMRVTLIYYSDTNPEKYDDELLDAFVFVDDVDGLYAEFAARGVEFTRNLANTSWNSREFVIKDRDGPLVAFGTNSK